MKKYLFIILSALFFSTLTAQDVWKYSAVATISSDWSDAQQARAVTLTGVDSVTSWYFGPGIRGVEYNGLLGLALNADSVARASRSDSVRTDTLSFYLVYDLLGSDVKHPTVLTWTNAYDSTETTTTIKVPADRGKIWLWTSNPVGDYLGQFPAGTYKLRAVSTDSAAVYLKTSWYSY